MEEDRNPTAQARRGRPVKGREDPAPHIHSLERLRGPFGREPGLEGSLREKEKTATCVSVCGSKRQERQNTICLRNRTFPPRGRLAKRQLSVRAAEREEVKRGRGVGSATAGMKS